LQLRMLRENLDNLPELIMPEGYQLRTYKPGDEDAWARIMNSGIGTDWTPQRCREELTGKPQFDPEGLFFATYAGQPVGSACAWTWSPDEHETGYVHMVCVLPEHRGHRLGYLLTLATLHRFRERGFKKAILDTDDFRLPAIKEYLKLGFVPLLREESHPERWRKVAEALGVQLPEPMLWEWEVLVNND